MPVETTRFFGLIGPTRVSSRGGRQNRPVHFVLLRAIPGMQRFGPPLLLWAQHRRGVGISVTCRAAAMTTPVSIAGWLSPSRRYTRRRHTGQIPS